MCRPLIQGPAISRFFLLVFLSAAVSPCIGATIDRPAALREYANAKPCCASFATARVEALQFGSQSDFQVDQQDQAFDFGTDGVSFFKLFKLPDIQQSYQCEISSHSLGDGRALNVFFPKIKVLDREFSELRSPGVIQEAAPTSNKMGGVSVTVPIVAGDQSGYLVVYTTHDYIANGESVKLQPRGPYLGGGAVPYILSTMLESGNVHFLGSPISGKGQMEIICISPK